MIDIEAPAVIGSLKPKPAAPLQDVDATKIARELARILEEQGLVNAHREVVSQWINLDEAAAMFGYSVSRFYHVYEGLGLVPSRASQRKLRFNRQDIERTLRERQRMRRGRPRRSSLRMKINGTKEVSRT